MPDLATHPRNIAKQAAENAAATLWQQMDRNEQTAIRFGMFPAGRMQAAEAAYLNVARDNGLTPVSDYGKLLACALMNQAQANGGMRA